MSLTVGLGVCEEDLDIQGEIDFDFFDNEQRPDKTSVLRCRKLSDENDFMIDSNCSEEQESGCDGRNRSIECSGLSGDEIRYNHYSGKGQLIETVIPSLMERHMTHMNMEDTLMENGNEDECHSVSSSVSMTDSEGSCYSEDSFDDLTESDSITDVTPLTSPCCDSPLPGLKTLQNRNVFRHRNEISSGVYSDEESSNDLCHRKRENVKFSENVHWNSNGEGDSIDLNALMSAIKQLEMEQNKTCAIEKKNPIAIANSAQKNMSFSNEKVRQIDRENQQLLKKILTQQNRAKPKHLLQKAYSSHPRPPSSAVNRLKQQRQIELENLALLKRIESAKPSRDVSRTHLLREYERLSSFSCSSRSSSRPQSASRKPYHSGGSSVQSSVRSTSLTSLHSTSKGNSTSFPPFQGKTKCIRPLSSRTYVIRPQPSLNPKS